MAGNPKSLKIDGLKDQYGRIIYNRQDCYEMLYNGEDISKIKELEWHEDIEKYNKAIGLNNLETDLLQPISKISKELSEFDDDNQKDWFIPDEYKNMDIWNYTLDKCPDDIPEMTRVCEELTLYDKYGIIDVLKVCVYIVDTLRKNNLVWGVGRGSSVASYVLYLLGVHKVDSIRYGLDINEFLK